MLSPFRKRRIIRKWAPIVARRYIALYGANAMPELMMEAERGSATRLRRAIIRAALRGIPGFR